MLPNQRFGREFKAWGLLLLGVGVLALSLALWNRLGRTERVGLPLLTPIFFAGALFYQRRLSRRRPKSSPARPPAPARPMRLAELPPARKG